MHFTDGGHRQNFMKNPSILGCKLPSLSSQIISSLKYKTKSSRKKPYKQINFMVNVDVSARPALRKIALESMHENTRKYEDCLCEA